MIDGGRAAAAPRGRTPALAALLALALAGCGAGDQTDGADGGPTPEVVASATEPTEPTEEPTSVPTFSEPISDPDGATPTAGAPCQPSQLSAVAGVVDAATGYRQVDVTVTNTSDLACTLDGFAGVDATGVDGTDLDLVRTDGSWNDPADGTARTVELAPSAAAVVLVGWRGDQVGTWDGQQYRDELTGWLQVVPDGTSDGPGVGVAIDSPALPLDIVDGQEVVTSAWLRPDPARPPA
ncbi:DUF4232 domain-containing protein [Nocardioides zeae]|uniref:DUF4232 domain-containing protein n=1 Tax=Nocardioides imazamoxiresistens TaxID=3231893 RepID=A0ABU3PUZ4_9ACTN|nr:DUF4232 domain-containing protein [Nocardioides zeae]MDT9593057.1 DUF4232 domain-containing protein [Nocardioides zeae]